MADILDTAAHRLECQLFFRKEQYCTRYGRLFVRGLIKIFQSFYFRLRNIALKGLVGLFYFGNERGDLVILRQLLRCELGAFVIETADESDAAEQVFGRVTDEIEKAVFLADLCSEHSWPPIEG